MRKSVTGASQAAKPKFLDQVRTILRTRHYSLRTEEAYVGWIGRLILFDGKRHPQEMGEAEVAAFDSFASHSFGLSARPSISPLPSLLHS